MARSSSLFFRTMRLMRALPCLLVLVLGLPSVAQPSIRSHPSLTAEASADTTGLSAALRAEAGQEARLTADDGGAEDAFGLAVSLSGDRALIGAPNHEEARGAAYVFVRTGNAWALEAKLMADDAMPSDILGTAVSLFGDRALVGAAWDDDAGSRSGSAYVFVRSGSTWTQEAKLVADDGAVDDEFGTAVSLSSDRALVGAPFDDDAGDSSGSAYVFVRSGSTWTQEAKLTAEDAAMLDFFGRTVSLFGDRALLGAQSKNVFGASSGAAYVFVRSGSTWTQEARLTVADGAAHDNFGSSVSLSADRALVLRSRFQENAAYLFVRSGSTWAQEARLTPPDGYEGFPGSVALYGDRALLVTRGDMEDVGIVYVRSGSTWTQEALLHTDEGTWGQGFGSSVSLSEDRALIGAFYETESAPNSGAAYVFAGIAPVAAESAASASSFVLTAYPNPARGASTLRLTLPSPQVATVAVYDLLGRRVAVLHDGPLAAGEHTLSFDAADLPSGVYLVRAAVGGEVTTRRITVVR